MSCLSIGSGDVPRLLMGKKTKGHRQLWQEFLATIPPYYNSWASPIDALRTGAILEERYVHTLSSDYFSQVKVQSKKIDCFTSSLDFARYEGGHVVDFEELKTIFLPDYLGLIRAIDELPYKDQINAIKKKFKNNYNQVQFQLFCSELESAKLSFLSVESYDDYENSTRMIEEKDVTKFVIKRDKEVIEQIVERGMIFQKVKEELS